MCNIFVNHKEEVKNSEDYVHCIEDGIRANVVLELVDEQEDCTFKEEVEDDGSIEQGLLWEGQKVSSTPEWKKRVFQF